MLTDDTGQTTVRLMDKLGIDRRVILVLDWGLALGEPSTDLWQIHREILGACNNHRDRLIGFAGVDPRRPHSSELICWAFDDLGAQGLKLHPTADWTLGDERPRHVVELAAHRALPAVVHVGRTVDVLSDRSSQPDAFLGLAREFPRHPLSRATVASDFGNSSLLIRMFLGTSISTSRAGKRLLRETPMALAPIWPHC